MPACKFSSTLTINKRDLPVDCKVRNTGIQVAATFFDAAGVETSLCKSSSTFQIPNTVSTGTGDLEVRVVSGTAPPPPVEVIENCDDSQHILTVFDSGTRLAHAKVVVL